VVQIEQMRAHLKGLSARIVMSPESMVTCASDISNIWHDGTLSFRNFIMMVKNSRITILSLFSPTAMIRPKSQNFKIGHDGILSIGNFILMIKNHILLFQLPGN
jgi:hypothetical protein